MNDNPKFTPGPWRAGESWRPPIVNFEVKDEDKDANGNIFWGYSIFGSNEHGGEVLPTLAAVHNFPDNMKANAHLIAAAPDLYEAAGFALDLLERVGDSRKDAPVIDALRAARAKAEGRS